MDTKKKRAPSKKPSPTQRERRRRTGQATVERARVAQLLLRPREVAEMLGISRSKAYELIASGQLPGVTFAGCRRVPADALRAWLSARTTAGSNAAA